MNETTSRILRTLAQLIAGGLLTALFEQVASDVSSSYAPYVLIASTLLVTICQNIVEEMTGTRFLRASAV
jgi:hypothetical protein